MPTYTFTGPGGQSFSITGEGSAQDAITQFQTYQAQQQAQTEQNLRPKLGELSRMSTDPATMERNVDIDRRSQLLQQAGNLQGSPGAGPDVATRWTNVSAGQPDVAPGPLTHVAARNLGMASMIPFSDELSSAMAAPLGLLPGHHGMAEEYNRQQEAEARARSEAQVLHPAAYGVGQAAGMIGTMGAPEGGLAAMAARGGVRPAARAVEGLGMQTARGIGTGAGIGALQGAGEGDPTGTFLESLNKRWQNAQTGAFYGGLIGGAAPTVLAGATGAANLVGSRFGRPIADWWSPDTAATAHLQRVIEADAASRAPLDPATGMPNPEAVANLERGAPEAFLQRFEAMQRNAPGTVPADVGGANVRGLVRTVTNIQGPGRESMLSTLKNRAARAGEQVAGAVRGVFGRPAAPPGLSRDVGDVNAEAARLAAEQEHLAGPLYDQAFASARPVDVTPVIQNLDQRLGTMSPGSVTGAEGIRPDSISNALIRIRNTLANAARGTQRWNLQQLHSVKVDLDGMITAAQTAGDTGKVAALMETKRTLLRAMDRASPLYQRARNIFADAGASQRALQTGRDVFTMTADQVRAATADMTRGERETFRIGLARAIQDKVEGKPLGFGPPTDTVGTNADVVKTIFSTPQVRNTLRAAFGDDQAFRRFHADMMRMARQRETYAAATANSTSAAQLSDIMNLKQASHAGVLTSLMSGNVGGAASAAVKQLLLGEQGMSSRVADRISRLLLTRDPQHIRNAITIMRARRVRAETIQRIVGNLGQGVAGVAGRVQGPGNGPLPPMLPEAAGGSGS